MTWFYDVGADNDEEFQLELSERPSWILYRIDAVASFEKENHVQE